MLAVLVGSAFIAPTAMAQMIDDVEVRRAGADAIVRLRFVTPIRLARSVVTPGGEISQIFYETLDNAGSRSALVPSERRVPGGEGLPTLIVSDAAVGAKPSERKLVVRASPARRVLVRSGGDTRSIDLVFDGLGDKVPAAVPEGAALPSSDSRRFQIVLQSTTDPSLQLQAPLPKGLRSYTLSSARRVAGGGTLYELILGPFANQVEADRALALLRPRFPKGPDQPHRQATRRPATCRRCRVEFHRADGRPSARS